MESDVSGDLPWSEIRRARLPASDARLYWKYAGLTPVEAILWWEHLIGPYAAGRAIEAGESLEDVLSAQAGAAEAAEQAALEAARWAAVGVSEADQEVAERSGLTPEAAAPWIDDRLPIRTIGQFVEAGVTRRQADEWLAAGFRLRDVGAELARGTSPEDVVTLAGERLLWKRMTASKAAAWQFVGMDAATALRAARNHVTPLHVWLEPDLPWATETIQVEHLDVVAIVDGDGLDPTQLVPSPNLTPAQVDRIESLEPQTRSSTFLKAFGFRVSVMTHYGRWKEAVLEGDGMLVELGRFGFGYYQGDTGDITVERASTDRALGISTVGQFPTWEAAVAATHPMQPVNEVRIEITSSMDLRTLLTLVEPWAADLPSGDPVQIEVGATDVKVVASADGVCRLLPEELDSTDDFEILWAESMSWLPGGPAEFSQSEEVGLYGDLVVLVAVGDMRTETLPIGRIRPSESALELAAPFADSYEIVAGAVRSCWRDAQADSGDPEPIMTIARFKIDGTTDRTSLTSTPDGWLLSEDAGTTRIESGNLFDVVRGQPALHDLRTSEITRIVIATSEPIERSALASSFQVVASENLSETGDADLAPLLDDWWDSHPVANGIERVAVFINDTQYLVVSTEPLALLPADGADWFYTVPTFEEWGQFTYCEEASRTSGIDRWRMGYSGAGFLVEIADLDEAIPSVATQRCPENRLRQIADWLASVGDDLSLDVPMLAVETIMGTPMAYADEFDEDGSPSGACGLWVAVSADEADEFCSVLGPRYVEALTGIRDPASPAGERRQQRLARADDG